jgi:hypothetical protein
VPAKTLIRGSSPHEGWFVADTAILEMKDFGDNHFTGD